jgi:hypothetical protein
MAQHRYMGDSRACEVPPERVVLGWNAVVARLLPLGAAKWRGATGNRCVMCAFAAHNCLVERERSIYMPEVDA